MNRFFVLFFLLLSLIALTTATAQEPLPTVYKLGEEEEALEQVQTTHQQTLLDACDGDMSKAFDLWLSFLKELEAYGKSAGCSLDGTSFWLQVFFSADGRIEHLGYYPKPDSRTVSDEELKTCLEAFVATYHMPVTTAKPFYNYTDVRFPLIYELYQRQ